MRSAILILLVMIISTSAFLLFYSAYYIEMQNRTLSAMHLEIKKLENDIAVLESEWSYLTRTEHLSELAAKHLSHLETPQALQVVSVRNFSHRSDRLVSYNASPELQSKIHAALSQ